MSEHTPAASSQMQSLFSLFRSPREFLRSTWAWFLPNFNADLQYKEVLKRPRFVWPAGVTIEAKRRFAEISARFCDAQNLAVERQAAKRDRLLTVTMSMAGVVFAAGQLFSLDRWSLVPAQFTLLVIAGYLLYCSRSHDRPIGIRAEAFLVQMPETLSEDEAIAWIIDSTEVTEAKFRAVSIAWGRHVNVATTGIVLVTAYLIIVTALVSASPARERPSSAEPSRARLPDPRQLDPPAPAARSAMPVKPPALPGGP